MMGPLLLRVGGALLPAVAPGVSRAATSAAPVLAPALRQLHSGRLSSTWEEVLRVAQSNPEKLHEIVDTLTNHCITAQTAPPLHHYNELLRICEAHADISSIHKLCHMACAVRMHLDAVTYERLHSAFAYFPRPFQAPGTSSSSSSSSASSSSSSRGGGGAAGAASSSSSSSRSRGTGRIHEAPPVAGLADCSTTGGASSVSSRSVSSGRAAATAGVSPPSSHLSGRPSVTVSDITGTTVSMTLGSSMLTLAAQQRLDRIEAAAAAAAAAAKAAAASAAAGSKAAPDAAAAAAAAAAPQPPGDDNKSRPAL